MHGISHAHVAMISVMDKNDPKKRSMRMFPHSLFTLIINKDSQLSCASSTTTCAYLLSVSLAQDYATADFMPDFWSGLPCSYNFNQTAKA